MLADFKKNNKLYAIGAHLRLHVPPVSLTTFTVSSSHFPTPSTWEKMTTWLSPQPVEAVSVASTCRSSYLYQQDLASHWLSICVLCSTSLGHYLSSRKLLRAMSSKPINPTLKDTLWHFSHTVEKQQATSDLCQVSNKCRAQPLSDLILGASCKLDSNAA